MCVFMVTACLNFDFLQGWYLPPVFIAHAVIMFLISWSFTVVSLALASLIYYYVSIKGKAGDWGDGFKSAYFQLALRSLRSLGGTCTCDNNYAVCLLLFHNSILYCGIDVYCCDLDLVVISNSCVDY